MNYQGKVQAGLARGLYIHVAVATQFHPNLVVYWPRFAQVSQGLRSNKPGASRMHKKLTSNLYFVAQIRRLNHGYIMQHKCKHGAAATQQKQYNNKHQHGPNQQRNQQEYCQTLSQFTLIQTAPSVFSFMPLAALVTCKLLSSIRIRIGHSNGSNSSKKTFIKLRLHLNSCLPLIIVLTDLFCSWYTICLSKAQVSVGILHVPLFWTQILLYRVQVCMELSFFVTNKTIIMTNTFKSVLEANLHWYWSILLFRMD